MTSQSWCFDKFLVLDKLIKNAKFHFHDPAILLLLMFSSTCVLIQIVMIKISKLKQTAFQSSMMFTEIKFSITKKKILKLLNFRVVRNKINFIKILAVARRRKIGLISGYLSKFKISLDFPSLLSRP